MKRSEREQQVLSVLEDFWRGSWAKVEDIRPALAKTLVEAEIANGAKFDPEEALPERLYFLESDSGEDWISTAPPRLIGHAIAQVPRHYPPYHLRRPILREAVRLYSAKPELLALVDCLGDDGLQDDRERRRLLLAILYGKEEP